MQVCSRMALLLHPLASFLEQSKVQFSWSYKTDKVLWQLTNSCRILSYNLIYRTINPNKGHSSRPEERTNQPVELSVEILRFYHS